MSKSKISNFTVEEVQQIVNNSTTKKEVAIKLGYSSDSGTVNNILTEYFEKNNIDTTSLNSKPIIKYTKETVFVQNGTIAQHNLVKWYKKENFEYKCTICGQEPEWNGKPLTLILDHINGIHTDDRLENLLWVCPNCNQQLDTTGGKNKQHTLKQNYCIDCGKEISINAIRCQSCSSKRQERKVENRPSKEELKKLIRIKPFTQIGKDYNVSDNAIRKWCDYYNLPRTKKEINSYSEEEWNKI